MKACDVLHPVKVDPKEWYLVGIDLIEAPTTSHFFWPVGARGLCNCLTAFRVSSSAAGLKRSFIHVCLLTALFSVLVFGCLESDDQSSRRLRHCSFVNSFIK